MTHNLPDDAAREICERFGVNFDGRRAQGSLDDARQFHGEEGTTLDGKPYKIDARALFTSYIEGIAYEDNCDGLASRDFERAAYGYDD